jgi:hypothetical protein
VTVGRCAAAMSVRLTSGEFSDAAHRLVARLDEIGLWT